MLLSPVGRVRSLTSRDAFEQHRQQNSPLTPRVLHASASQGRTFPHEEYIKSPPRVGMRRRSSASHNAAPEFSTMASSIEGHPRRKRTAPIDEPRVGGGMLLSRSLGALGQVGVVRSALAIVNTRDDGAPYLRSERMSRAAASAPAQVSTAANGGRHFVRYCRCAW